MTLNKVGTSEVPITQNKFSVAIIIKIDLCYSFLWSGQDRT